MNFSAVILAAGKGVRMRSNLPKVAHRVAGRPMVHHVVKAVKAAGIEEIIVVVGHGRHHVEEILEAENVIFAVQEEQLGTGHALMQAKGKISRDNLLVLAGDTPLLSAETLLNLINTHSSSSADATVLTTNIKDAHGYGRIVRDSRKKFRYIIEEKDASDKERLISEINSGIYCFNSQIVFSALSGVGTENAQGEYYLTDVLSILKKDRKKVETCLNNNEEEIYGVNDRQQLSLVEGIMRQRINNELMARGIRIMDPVSTLIDADVEIEEDTVILPFTMIEGYCQIGRSCQIGPFTRISNSSIGNEVSIESSRVNEAKIGNSCTIGPFAYLRPDAVLDESVKIGDFVEVKKSFIGAHSKVPHLSYVGDAQVGERVNVGAGTITCNYDGVHKYPTILEDGVFIGSNTNLVAPVRIGKDSVTGAGSTVTKDVPPDSLAVERAAQKIISNWSKRKR